MKGQLTTYGPKTPRYSREVEVQIDPRIFIDLEVRASAISLGEAATVFGILEVDGRCYEASAIGEEILV